MTDFVKCGGNNKIASALEGFFFLVVVVVVKSIV